jgi:hypothetical protein
MNSTVIRALMFGQTITPAFLIFAGLLAFTTLVPSRVTAQNPRLEARVTEVQRATVANEEALAYYTWQEQQTISINGEVRKQTLFQVQIGPDAKPLRAEIETGNESSGEAHRHGLIRQIVETKTEGYEDYVKQITALAQAYAHPNPERLWQLLQRGSITLGSAGFQGEFQLVVQNYLKAGDSVTLLFNSEQKALVSVQVSSYVSDPREPVTMSTQFVRLPSGLNHVSSMLINDESKQVTVMVQASDYQKM